MWLAFNNTGIFCLLKDNKEKTPLFLEITKKRRRDELLGVCCPSLFADVVEGVHSRELRLIAKLFFDAKELVIFANAVRAAH